MTDRTSLARNEQPGEAETGEAFDIANGIYKVLNHKQPHTAVWFVERLRRGLRMFESMADIMVEAIKMSLGMAPRRAKDGTVGQSAG